MIDIAIVRSRTRDKSRSFRDFLKAQNQRMALYYVEIVSKAEKEYLGLPQSVKNRIQELILSLEKEPGPFGSKKRRETDYYGISVGDYRIVYMDENRNSLISIILWVCCFSCRVRYEKG